MISAEHHGIEAMGQAQAQFDPATLQLLGASVVASSLPAEQRQFATAVAGGMVETLGVAPATIDLVAADHPVLGRQVVVIDASPNGQHIGLYRDVLAHRAEDPDWYTIEVNGNRIDPLAGCTQYAYQAMVASARARREPFLQDSLALNQHNGHVWTATMMTGDPMPSTGKIMIGSSSSYSKVNFVEHPINRGGKSFRVRPAVVVGQL